MKFEVHFSIGDDVDSIIIEGDNIEEVRDKVTHEMDQRGATYGWSERLA